MKALIAQFGRLTSFTGRGGLGFGLIQKGVNSSTISIGEKMLDENLKPRQITPISLGLCGDYNYY